MDEKKLLKYAVDYLSKYDSSKNNLINIINRKIYRLRITDIEKRVMLKSTKVILKKLENSNLIDDKKYSLSKISFLSKMGKSKYFISNYLIKKGVNKYDIKNSFQEFENNNNNNNWELMSAKLFAKKRKLLESNENYEKKLAKMARAGFSYDICKKILN